MVLHHSGWNLFVISFAVVECFYTAYGLQDRSEKPGEAL